MERTEVESTNIKSVGYDVDTKTLEVEFLTGAVYQYRDVPPEKYQELLEAESVGKYFYAQVRAKGYFASLVHDPTDTGDAKE